MEKFMVENLAKVKILTVDLQTNSRGQGGEEYYFFVIFLCRGIFRNPCM
jgi:hypothetical protein